MKTIVGLFDNASDAQQVVNDLEAAGVSRNNISIVASQQGAGGSSGSSGSRGEDAAGGAASGAMTGGVLGALAGAALIALPGGPILAAGPLLAGALTGAGVGAAAGGLVGALTGAGVPEDEARYYDEGVRRGGTLVTVSAEDNQADRVTDIMNRYNPVDIDERRSQWGLDAGAPTGGTGAGTGGRFDAKRDLSYPESTPSYAANVAAAGAPAMPVGQSGVSNANVDEFTTSGNSLGAGAPRLVEGQEAIPVVEEELHVGKREVQRGGVRVHSRVEERPVEESVSLREERAVVERRPVDRPASQADLGNAFRESTLEVTERAEIPMVSKEARVVEEVVVGKEVSQRTETVRDTVRRTDVEVQQVGFEQLEGDFRTEWERAHPGQSYDEVRPVYQHGYEWANRGKGDWSSVEPDAQRDWESRNPGSTWDRVKDTARSAYDRARQKI
jgi:uncharacterized protein (TIGR02271 family)